MSCIRFTIDFNIRRKLHHFCPTFFYLLSLSCANANSLCSSTNTPSIFSLYRFILLIFVWFKVAVTRIKQIFSLFLMNNRSILTMRMQTCKIHQNTTTTTKKKTKQQQKSNLIWCNNLRWTREILLWFIINCDAKIISMAISNPNKMKLVPSKCITIHTHTTKSSPDRIDCWITIVVHSRSKCVCVINVRRAFKTEQTIDRASARARQKEDTYTVAGSSNFCHVLHSRCTVPENYIINLSKIMNSWFIFISKTYFPYTFMQKPWCPCATGKAAATVTAVAICLHNVCRSHLSYR